MGLIKAAISSISGTLSDAWKEYFVCDSLDNDVLLVKGSKKGNNGTSDVITNGSGIVVNDGQCALVVEEGKIVEVAAEPGRYTFDTSISPTVFAGWQGIKDTFKEMVERFTYDGVADKTQRVYYINTKEILGNMYGTATPIPFRVIDKNINLDVDISLRCNGEYSFEIVNPLLFYKNVVGNETNSYSKEELVSQMRSELLTALQPALAKIGSSGVRYSEIPGHANELVDVLNEQLSSKWNDLRGIKIKSFGINSLSASKEDEDMIKSLQKAATMKDPGMMAANLAAAQADAMRDAANNAGGAAVGFMGLNMAGNGVSSTINAAMAQSGVNNNASTWTCECGHTNDGNFCSNCGKAKPTNKFCPNCGNKVDDGAKFCTNCGKAL